MMIIKLGKLPKEIFKYIFVVYILELSAKLHIKFQYSFRNRAKKYICGG